VVFEDKIFKELIFPVGAPLDIKPNLDFNKLDSALRPETFMFDLVVPGP
jgi:hypothetical protein